MFSRFKKHIAVMVAVMMIVTCLPFSLLVRADKVPVLKYVFKNENDETDLRFEDSDDEIDGYNLAGIYVSESSFELTAGMEDLAIVANNADIDGTAAALDEETEIYLLGDSTLKANQYITYASINPNTEFTDELTAENLFGHLEVWGDQLEDFYEFRVTEDYSLDAPGEGLSEKNLKVMEDVTFNLNSSFDTSNAVIDGNLVIKDPENGMINRFMLAYSDNDYAGSLTVSATGSLTGEANTELVIGDNIPVNGLDLFENDGVTPILLDDDHDEVTFVWDDGKWILGDFDGPWGPGMIISNQGGEIKEVKYSLDSSSEMYSATERDGEFFISRDIYEDAESVTIYPELWGYGAELSYDVSWDKDGEGETKAYSFTYSDEKLILEKTDEGWGERFDIFLVTEYKGVAVFYDDDKVASASYQFDGDDFSYTLSNHNIPLNRLLNSTGVTITINPENDIYVREADCFADTEEGMLEINAPQFTVEGNKYRLEPSQDDGWYEWYQVVIPMSYPGLNVSYNMGIINGMEYEFENGSRKELVDYHIDPEEFSGDYVTLYLDLRTGGVINNVKVLSIGANGQEYSMVYDQIDNNESILISKPEGWTEWGKYILVDFEFSRPGMLVNYDNFDWIVEYSVDDGVTKVPFVVDDGDAFITPDKYEDADRITFYAYPAREEGGPDFEAGYQYTDYGEGVAWIDADTSNHEFTIEKGADGWHDEYEIWISYPNHEGEDDEPLVDGVNFRYNGEDISKIEYAFDDSTEFTELSDSRVIAPEELADHESLTFKVTMAGNDFKLKNINAEGILLEEDGERWYWLDSGDGEYVEDLSTLTFTLYKHQEEDVDPFWLDRYRFELITTGSGLEIYFPYDEIEKVEYLVGDEFKTLEDNIIFPDELDQMEDGISFRLTYLNDAFFSNASVSCDYDNPEIEQYYSGSDWDSDRWSYDPETRILTFTFPDGITWGKYNELSLFTDVPGISVKYFDSEMDVLCFGEGLEGHRLEREKFVNEECIVFTLNPYDPSREWVAEFSEGNGEKTTLPIENNEIVINRPADGWAEFYTLDIHEKDDHHDPRIFPDDGYFQVEYDMREIGWPAEQTAFVKVDGVNVDTYTYTAFTVDTPVTFTLVPPEGLENEPRVVVIENRDGTCASTYDNSIIITNDEFTFTPASDKGFIVKVYWSLFDATHAGSDQVEINIRTSGGAEAAIEDPFASINNPAPWSEGLSETRYIVNQSEGAIEVIFWATDPAAITGVSVTGYDGSRHHYSLDEMEASSLFNYDAETGKWSYYINDLPGEDDGNVMSIEIFASEPETFTSMFCIDAGEDVSVEYAYIRGENQDPYTAYTGQFDTDTTADAIKIKFTQADGQPLNPLRVAETIPFGPIVDHVIRLDDDNTITFTKNPEDGWHAYMIDFEEEGMPADGEFIIRTIGYDSNPVLNYDAETIYTFEPGQTVTIDLGDEEPAYVIAYNSREELDYLERSADGKYSYTTDADWPEALVIKIFRTQDDKDFDGFTPDMDEMALEFHVFYNDYPEGEGHQSVVNFNADDGKWMTSSDGTKTVVHVNEDIESYSFDVRIDNDECREIIVMLNGVDVTNQIDEHGVFTVDADTIRAGLNLSFTFNYRRTFDINGVVGEGGMAGIPTNAKEGETVEITGICPIAGYEFDAIVVRYGPDDQIIPVTDNSFVMPSSDVTVYVNFKKINYTITKADMENGTVTVKSTATVGEQVTVTPNPAAGYDLDEINVYTVNGGVVELVNGVFTMPSENVIVEATFVEHISEPASINAITLDLNDHISINYKMVLPEELLADTGAYVTIVREDTTTNYLISQAEMDKGRHVFRCYLAAAELRDTVVFSVHRSDGSVYPLLNKEGEDVTATGFVYSAQAYYEGVKTNGSYPAALLKVLERMLDYGKYAQLYFNYNSDAGSLTPEAETLISGVTLETLDKFKPVIVTATGSPITRSGSTLDLREATVLAHNFVIASGYSVDDFVFTVDGNVVTMSSTGAYRLVYENGKYKLVISGIGSGELQKTHKVIVRSASSGEVLIAIGNYSALSYVYTVVEKINPDTAPASNLNLLKTMKALYLYNRAAMAYWGGEDEVVDLDPEELPIVVNSQDAAEEAAVVDEAEAVVVDETAVDEAVVDETAAEPVAEESVAEVEGDTVDEAAEEVAEPVAGTVETVEAVDTVEETAAE